jgi:hypothetical protein
MKKKMPKIKIPIKHIKRLVDFYYDTEEQDYNKNPNKFHIFKTLKLVDAWVKEKIRSEHRSNLQKENYDSLHL